MCLDNTDIYILGKKIDMILLHSTDILVTDMEEITVIRQGDRPQVMLRIEKNTPKMCVVQKPLLNCQEKIVLNVGFCSKQQLGNFWFLVGKSVSFYLKYSWITAQPSVTDVDNIKATSGRNSHNNNKKIMTKTAILPTRTCGLNL